MTIKIVSIFLLWSLSFSVFSKSVRLRKIDDLLKRVSVLERKVAALEAAGISKKTEKIKDKSTGLKTKDLKNKKISNESERSVATASEAKDLSPEKKAEMMEKIEKFKESFGERQKFLDELMQEP